MHLFIRALEFHTPEFIKKRTLKQLLHSTAAAFEADVPSIRALDSRECLAAYARFVQVQAEKQLRHDRDGKALAQRLYQNAASMGRLPGKWLPLNTVQDVMAIGRVLYRILDIDFRGNAQGEIVIQHCYFSRFYSAEVCRLMSAMDRGLFAGLSNGGELTFTSRITEGQPCCRAHFCWPPGR
ncbi:MAG: hypothetical protein ACM3PS_06340 [Syntrophothermus sp.]